MFRPRIRQTCGCEHVSQAKTALGGRRSEFDQHADQTDVKFRFRWVVGGGKLKGAIFCTAKIAERKRKNSNTPFLRADLPRSPIGRRASCRMR
jgi:hypothetical protein